MADEFDLDFEEPTQPAKGTSSKKQVTKSTDDVPRMPCPMCGAQIAKAARKCRFCGEVLATAADRGKSSSNETMNKLIPYKNGYALAAYYLGLLGMLPCAPIGIAAFVLGILGVMKVRKNPEVHGTVHAWIGIVMGFFFGGLWTILTIVGMVAAVMEANKH
jgi:predicted RNA-binding Zn-ribbon protein involved in translation (DUF1610 family)